MKVRFWGVRGSIPTPITPQQIQNKITAIIQRITPKDVETPDAKERFISKLPEWLYGTAGGNTPCVEIKAEDGTEIVLDAGSGLRVLGTLGNRPSDNHYNIFISHFHWDHIHGIPFFEPAYKPETKLDFYSFDENAEQYFTMQQNIPFFPVSFRTLTKNIKFHTVKPMEPFAVGGIRVNACRMSHPGGSTCFSLEEDGQKIVYATDVELSQKDFTATDEHEAVFRNADCIILDSQYTVEEAYKKENWGHSAFCYSVDFAVHWGIRKLYLYHHEPNYDDKKLNSILKSARWYAKYVCHSEIEVYLAIENQEFDV